MPDLVKSSDHVKKNWKLQPQSRKEDSNNSNNWTFHQISKLKLENMLSVTLHKPLESVLEFIDISVNKSAKYFF